MLPIGNRRATENDIFCATVVLSISKKKKTSIILCILTQHLNWTKNLWVVCGQLFDKTKIKIEKSSICCFWELVSMETIQNGHQSKILEESFFSSSLQYDWILFSVWYFDFKSLKSYVILIKFVDKTFGKLS